MNYYHIVPLLRKAKYMGHATYASADTLQPGQIVAIPYGQRTIGGVVISSASRPKFATKDITAQDVRGSLHPDLVQLSAWFAEYYCMSQTESFLTMLPNGVHKKRRATSTAQNKKIVEPLPLPALTKDQTAVVNQLQANPKPALLHGVTGSGKTRIYIELIRRAVKAGQSSVVLVPEIALSSHILNRIQEAFTTRLYHLHSNLSESEAHVLWQTIQASDEPVIVVGPRSAIFAPVPDLGLVIIDECHDSSYKQETTPTYSALHVAGARAKLACAKIVMGSATPNLTEYYLAQQDKLDLIELPNRINAAGNHQVSIVSKLAPANFSTNRILSDELLASIESSINNRKMSLLFLNRRGFSPVVLCDSCGWRAECPSCDGPLNYHASTSQYQCHICGHSQSPQMNCPQCQSPDIIYAGVGTQKLESEVKKLFTTARIIRLDKDTVDAAGYNQHESFQAIESGQIDILIGTQMLGKGFDFGNLETVGIIDADTMLYLPDYRSNEVTFQTITQAIGRNDRRGLGGRTIVQTASPDNHAIVNSLQENYAAFYAQELELRKQAKYPPFSYLLKLTARRPSDAQAQTVLAAIKQDAQRAGLRVLGPAPALHHSPRKRVWNLILQSPSRRHLIEFCKQHAQLDIVINFDPLNLM